MQITRRNALLGATAAAAVTGLTVAPLAARGPRIEDIQALVSDLRNCDRNIMMAVFVAFQEVADRLETLPGVVPVPNEMWLGCKAWVARDRIGPYLTAGRA